MGSLVTIASVVKTPFDSAFYNNNPEFCILAFSYYTSDFSWCFDLIFYRFLNLFVFLRQLV